MIGSYPPASAPFTFEFPKFSFNEAPKGMVGCIHYYFAAFIVVLTALLCLCVVCYFPIMIINEYRHRHLRWLMKRTALPRQIPSQEFLPRLGRTQTSGIRLRLHHQQNLVVVEIDLRWFLSLSSMYVIIISNESKPQSQSVQQN